MSRDPDEQRQIEIWRRLTDEQAAIDAVSTALLAGRLIHSLEARDPEKQVARRLIERLDSAGFILIRKGW